MLRTIAICTASVNPDRAQNALTRLIEEAFPEVAKDREKAVEKAMEIMEREQEREYAVTQVGTSTRGSPWSRTRDILKNRRRRGQ